ncbi:MAG: 30S ribosomal protein S17 [Patescibacteria group bacterium]
MPNIKKENKKRKLSGIIVSDKMNKTRVVAIERLKLHPIYLKRFKATKRLKVHDEKNEYKKGDKVIIQETRPLSREKRWIIVSKLK